jgi:hypothetical protein
LSESNPFVEFTDADLKAAMHRSLRTIAILAVVLAVATSLFAGWRSGLLLIVGAIVSASGVYEWQRLIGVVNERLDNAKNPRSAGPVVAMFFLRLLLAAGFVYVSLKCFHGSIYALLAGLALAVVGLSIEAVRLVRA